MGKFIEINAHEVHPTFMEAHARTVEETKAADSRQTSKFLQDAHGVVEINAGPGGGGGGRVRVRGTQTVTSAEALQGGLPGSIMSTVQSRAGSPISDQTRLTPDSLVTIGGVQCTLETAVRTGMVVRNADGSYVDAYSPAAPQAPRQQQPKQQPQRQQQPQAAPRQQQRVDIGNIESEPLAVFARESLGADTADNAIVRILMNAAAGMDTTGAVKDLALALDMEPGDIIADAGDMADDILQSAAEFITKNYDGVDGEEALDGMGKHVRPESQASVMSAIYHGNVKVIDHLVSKFRIRERF
jgi:hypothetical protein